MRLKIAIFSDFHCHNKANNNNIQESYLLTDIDVELFQDPFKSFKHLIENEVALTSDVLILPGDFTNKCDPEGLKYGWGLAKEIGNLLKVQSILPNIGNHDVDSRKKRGDNPFELIKTFADDFPFPKNATNELFWDQGYVIVESETYRVLIINSVHSHTNEEMATKGLIDQITINKIEQELSSSSKDKINIAVCHHNPIEHSHYNTGSKDFMFNGDEIIEILDKMSFDIIIHGHKHDPRIRYSQGGANSPTIFSSGSFSAFKNLQLQGANNTFHIITFECSDSQIGKGTIDTWFFVPTKGWKQNIKSNFFEPRIGFGQVVDIKSLSARIHTWFVEGVTTYVDWSDFINTFNEIEFMIPSDIEKLKVELKNKNILISPIIFNEPTFVQFKR